MSQPIYTRLHKAPEVFGVSVSTIYRWAESGLVKIHKRGRASFLRTDEVILAVEGMGEQLGE
jgi:predicted site-specific integrase-resolvase